LSSASTTSNASAPITDAAFGAEDHLGHVARDQFRRRDPLDGQDVQECRIELQIEGDHRRDPAENDVFCRALLEAAMVAALRRRPQGRVIDIDAWRFDELLRKINSAMLPPRLKDRARQIKEEASRILHSKADVEKNSRRQRLRPFANVRDHIRAVRVWPKTLEARFLVGLVRVSTPSA